MEKKISDNFGQICTIVGGVLLGVAIVEKMTDGSGSISDIQKLMSGDIVKNIPMLEDKQEKKEKPEHDEEDKKHTDEMAELKRKLAEYEGKKDKEESE